MNEHHSAALPAGRERRPGSGGEIHRWAGFRAGKRETVLAAAIAKGVAGEAEPLGGTRDVAAGLLKRVE
jgi:hypothetical protein